MLARYARLEEVPDMLAIDSPVIVAPVTFKEEVTITMPSVPEVIVV